MSTNQNLIQLSSYDRVEWNPVYVNHDIFNPDRAEVEDLKRRYREGQVRDVEVKEKLIVAVEEFLRPIRERRARYAADPKGVDRIIEEGSERARAEARKTLHEARSAMHLDYFGL